MISVCVGVVHSPCRCVMCSSRSRSVSKDAGSSLSSIPASVQSALYCCCFFGQYLAQCPFSPQRKQMSESSFHIRSLLPWNPPLFHPHPRPLEYPRGVPVNIVSVALCRSVSLLSLFLLSPSLISFSACTACASIKLSFPESHWMHVCFNRLATSSLRPLMKLFLRWASHGVISCAFTSGGGVNPLCVLWASVKRVK